MGVRRRTPATRGKVCKEEFTGPEPLFERLDLNKDGFLTAGEPARAMGLGPGEGITPEARFRALDRDGDGRLSRDEFPGRPQGFERLDTNQDGYLTIEEMRAGLPASKGNEK